MKRIFLTNLFLMCCCLLMAALPDAATDSERQYYYQRLRISDLTVKERIAVMDTLMQYSKKAGNGKEWVRLLIQRADTEFDNHLYISAFYSYRLALSHITSGKLDGIFSGELVRVHLRLGKTCYFLGKYDDGIFYMYELLRDNRLNAMIKTEAYIQLGNLYLRLQKNSFALKHLAEAERVLNGMSAVSNTSLSDLRCNLYICYSSVYIQKGMRQEAFACIEKAKRECHENRQALGQIYQNIAILYWETGDLKTTENFYEKAIKLSDNPYIRSVLLNNQAIIYMEQKRYEAALAVLRKNLEIVREIEAAHVTGNLYSIFSRVYSGLGNYKKALDYRLKEQEVLDSIFDKESEERIMMLNSRYETEKLKYEKELVEYKLKVAQLSNFKKNTLIVFLVVLSVVILILILFAIQKVRKQKWKNSLLKKELDTINENKNKILQSFREKYEMEINYKARELTSNTMYIAKMCDIANQILKDTNRLALFCESGKAQEILRNMQQQINSLTIEERGWNDFKFYFEQIHPSFFPKLHDAFPNLTSGENRMCAFIVMNLSTKEIADLTYRTLRTVETSKFRIRKKLDVPKEMSTLSFLQQFIIRPDNK